MMSEHAQDVVNRYGEELYGYGYAPLDDHRPLGAEPRTVAPAVTFEVALVENSSRSLSLVLRALEQWRAQHPTVVLSVALSQGTGYDRVVPYAAVICRGSLAIQPVEGIMDTLGLALGLCTALAKALRMSDLTVNASGFLYHLRRGEPANG